MQTHIVRTYTASDLELIDRMTKECEDIRYFAQALTDENHNFVDPEWSDRLDEVRDMLIQLRCDLHTANYEGWD